MNAPRFEPTLPPQQSMEDRSGDTIATPSDSTLFGDHELLDEVARGGMGIVYRARQRSLDRIVALKLIISGHEASEQELGRFEIEAKAAARLDHPYIVPVYSFGKMNGQPFFTMGFVEGVSLAARLARDGALHPNDAAELIKLVAYALDYAHSQNVVHRDIKPGNILIDEDGQPRVTDFGLAKRQDAEQGMTATGQVLGTPTYMAPEQASGEEAGPAADIYSLGATLYATLTGGPPFEATSLPELLLKITDEAPVPPHTKNPAVPEPLSQITMRCLAKRPEDRYASARELAEDLERFQEGNALRKRTVAGKPRKWVFAAALVLLPIIGFAAWKLMHNKAASVTPTPAKEIISEGKVEDKSPRYTSTETQLVADLETARDGIFPTRTEGPWLLRYEESAKAFKTAFETAGVDVLKLDPEEYAVTLKTRPAELRESILIGFELWELMATAAKLPEAPLLRAVQTSIDEVDWRRRMRILREDNKAPEILAAITGLDATDITESQLSVLGLMVWVHAANVPKATLAALTHLQSLAPDSYWLNMVQATELLSESSINANEKTNLLTTAISPLRTAQSAHPKSPSPASLLSRVFEELGNRSASESEAEFANALSNPVAWEHLNVARQARKDGNLAAAIREAELAVKESPTFMPSLVELAKYSIEQKNDSKLAEALKRLVNLPASESEAMIIVFKIYEDLGNTDQVSIARRLINPAVSRRRAQAWQAVVNYRESITYKAFEQLAFERNAIGEDPLPALHQAVRLKPNGADILRLLAFSIVQQNGDPSEAIKAVKQAAELDGVTDSITLAVANARLGNVNETLRLFRENVLSGRGKGVFSSTDSSRLYLYQHLASAYGFSDEALRELSIGLVRDGSSLRPTDLLCMAILEARRGNDGAAQKYLRNAIKGFSSFNFFLVRGLYLQALLWIGNRELSQSLLLDMIAFEPQNHRTWLMLSLSAMQRGDLELAVYATEKALNIAVDPEYQSRLDYDLEHNFLVTINESVRGLVLLTSGDLERAIDCLAPLYLTHKAEDLFKIHAWSLTGGYSGDYIRALVAHGELELARRICVEQMKRLPDEANVHWACGVLCLAERDAEAAIAPLELAAKLDPFNGLIELDLARALIELGQFRIALPHLQKAVTMASQGKMRGFCTVAVEAAELALQAANKGDFTASQQSVCRVRAFEWLKSEIAKHKDHLNSIDPLDQAAAVQVLARILECPATARLKKNMLELGVSDAEQILWNELWSEIELLVANASSLKLLTVEERISYLVNLAQEENRRVAEWVLQKGGTVLIREKSKDWLDTKVSQLSSLPKDTFVLIGISFHNCQTIKDEIIVELPPVLRLEQLYLEGTSVTDKSVQASAEKFPSLRVLNLDRTNITDQSLPWLKAIDFVGLRETPISPAMLDEFEASRSHLTGFGLLRDKEVNSNELEPRDRNFALRLDGLNSIDTKVVRNSGLPTTIEALVCYPATMVTRYSYPLHGLSASGSNSILALNINRRALRGESREASKNIFNAKTIPILHEVWTHVAIVYDGQAMRSFVDGKLIDSVRFAIVPADLRYRIGGNGFGYNFEGDLDEIRISSTARYTTDFQPALRHEVDEHTLALYHFDAGEGEISRDASPHGHDLQINGMRWVQREE